MFFLSFLIFSCCVFESGETLRQQHYDWQVPAAGLMVVIDPNEMFGDGLTRSWNRIDERFGKRHIKSRPFSKANFELTPVCSADCITLGLKVIGTSVGQSEARSRAVNVTTDSFTKFATNQTIFINTLGVVSTAPVIDVTTAQSFNRAKSNKNPLSGVFVKSAFKKFPEEINSKAEIFARQQVERQLHASVASATNGMIQSIRRFSERRPKVADLPWIFSSDNHCIYLSAFSKQLVQDVVPDTSDPATILIHESFASDWLETQLGGKTFRSGEIEKFYRQTAGDLQLPNLSASDDKPWSVKFEPSPALVAFENNRIKLEFATSYFATETRQLPSMKIHLDYQLNYRRPSWHLDRSETISIAGADSGARQQVLRSIMRKRFERILPRSIAIQDLKLNPAGKRNGIDLEIREISTNSHFVVVGLDQTE